MVNDLICPDGKTALEIWDEFGAQYNPNDAWCAFSDSTGRLESSSNPHDLASYTDNALAVHIVDDEGDQGIDDLFTVFNKYEEISDRHQEEEEEKEE